MVLLCLRPPCLQCSGSVPAYYTSKVIAMVSVTLTAAGIPGVDLNELLLLFWHRYQESANKLATATS